MPDPSRREIIAKGVAGVAAASLPILSGAQTPTPPPPPTVSFEEAERPLAKPLKPEIRKLLQPALEANAGNAKQRLQHKLPENSEPCFTYIPGGREVRRR